MRQTNAFSLFSLILLLSMISCDQKRFFEENKSIEGGVWKRKNFQSFKVNISDTVSRYNIYLNVRNDGLYPFSNLYLFIHTVIPGKQRATDTVECQLAEPDGKWRGSGFGSLKFNRFLFQRSMKFPNRGLYTFQLEQAMRVDDLKGIRDVGIRIEKQ